MSVPSAGRTLHNQKEAQFFLKPDAVGIYFSADILTENIILKSMVFSLAPCVYFGSGCLN
jgi:hypothetical protein